MDGLAQVNFVVTDLARAKEFWALLGWRSTPRHPNAEVLSFPNGMNVVLHEPEFARLWDPAHAGPAAGSTVVDVNLSSRDAVDDAHARVVAAGYLSSVTECRACRSPDERAGARCRPDRFLGARSRDGDGAAPER